MDCADKTEHPGKNGTDPLGSANVLGRYERARQDETDKRNDERILRLRSFREQQNALYIRQTLNLSDGGLTAYLSFTRSNAMRFFQGSSNGTMTLNELSRSCFVPPRLVTNDSKERRRDSDFAHTLFTCTESLCLAHVIVVARPRLIVASS